jgi:RND family efflux transporter MFP subunit
MKTIYKYLIAGVFIALGAFVFYNKVYIPKTTYLHVNAKKGSLDVKVFGIGNVSAKTVYKITPGVSAKILSINTDEGKWVKKGELLVVLDSVDLPILLEQSKIAVTKAQAELESLKKELGSLLAQKNLAYITFKRYEKLKAQSFASQSEFDKAQADLKVIEAQIASTKAKINSAKTEITKAKKGVESLEKKLSQYRIYAPIDGYVTLKNGSTGEMLLPTQTLLEVVSPKDVRIKAYIDEQISGDLHVGDVATITLRSQQKHPYKGYVKRILAQSDPITQERTIEVAFEKLPIPFYMNEQAEVSIATHHLSDVILIPSKSLIHKKTLTGVWTLKNNTAHFTHVEVLGIDGENAAVKGLDATATLLLATPKNKPLKEGMKVH